MNNLEKKAHIHTVIFMLILWTITLSYYFFGWKVGTFCLVSVIIYSVAFEKTMYLLEQEEISKKAEERQIQ